MSILKKSKQSQTELIRKFSALGDATRYRLFQILKEKTDICVSELAGEIGISNAGVSQQLKIMEQAGIIRRTRQGQKICYQIDYENQSNSQLIKLVD